MIPLLVASSVAFLVSILLTPVAIRVLRERNIGQFIQEEVEGHSHKRGTPTMGGLVMWVAVTAGYVVAHIRVFDFDDGLGLSVTPFEVQGLLALFGFLGMGVIGFADDYAKFARKQNLGLSKRWKFLGQLAIAAIFAWWASAAGLSTELFLTREAAIDLGPWLYTVLVLLMLAGTANAVNLTDGLDGLVAGSGALVFGAYVLIAFWEFRNFDLYGVEGALDLGVFAAAIVGAVLGFLWWNAAPADIFMGDAGSQALGGGLAALALLTRTHLLLVVLGGLYVMVTMSVIIQVFSFRVFGKRVFKIAPVHHHFEMKGWPETTVIVRFWIIAGIFVAVGVGIFYADFLVATEGGITP
ncbi:MAG TPA: phospho-N-acetylmuramoyl-pentapeptide-transferase [Acidimicrobiia bacterium]|nr:phospho-N-acetylmuramoyl-pentapeptide-transferase [Acidimicrobiia bacterium]